MAHASFWSILTAGRTLVRLANPICTRALCLSVACCFIFAEYSEAFAASPVVVGESGPPVGFHQAQNPPNKPIRGLDLTSGGSISVVHLGGICNQQVVRRRLQKQLQPSQE